MGREGKLYENQHHVGLLVLVFMLVVGVVNSTSPSGGGAMEATMVKRKKEVMTMMVRCRANERKALLEFKKGLVDEYGILSSWGSRDCCQWRGIQCSNRTRHVIAIHLPGRYESGYGLGGKVSPSLFELKHLKYLNLRDNFFWDSPFPEFIGSLTKLQYLDLSDADFDGQNLEWLSHLRLLRYLDLSGINLKNNTDWLQQVHKLSFLTELHMSSCNLLSPLLPLNNSSSSVPLAIVDLSYNYFNSSSHFNWLFNLSSSLVYIDMSFNTLGGSVPEAFGIMPSLESLRLSSCQLEGELPKFLKNSSHLKSLDLSVNNLTGQLDEFFQTLTDTEMNSLQILNLASNKLSGYFPERLGQIPSLRELYLSNNQLQGTISEAYLSNLSKLKILDLSFNSLALEFSFDWDPPFQLEIIHLAYCNLTRFPKWLQSQRNLSSLDISGVGISGSIPNWFWDLTPRLEYLNMSHNQIQGVIPELSWKFFVDRAFIDLSSNHFKGPIPILPPNVSLLYLSENMFTGSVSPLRLCAANFLNFLDLSDNQLSGELPDCRMRYPRVLNLANNNFSGKIPTSIGFQLNLAVLQLRNNSFAGALPSSLKDCSELTLLDLSENKVSGEIPTWIGTHLTNLVVISLRKNEFFGSIPPQICYLNQAQVLDLSQNYISGDIPVCFNNLTSLCQVHISGLGIGRSIYLDNISHYHKNYVENALVQWKGKESYYGKNLGLLKLIDLSRNKLVGKIPLEFSSLKGLISLNLSVNNLTGNIIEKIGQMKMLESLDLSRNQLSGEIPTSLASLTFLSVMDLSNNNFSGKIPSSTQLQGFNVSMYAGNDKLCGLPLPSKCPEDELNLLPPPIGHGKYENNEVDGDRFVTIGFYISVILGFALGFWGFFGPILLQSTWRHAYFKFLDKTKDWIYVTTVVKMARLQRKIGG